MWNRGIGVFLVLPFALSMAGCGLPADGLGSKPEGGPENQAADGSASQPQVTSGRLIVLDGAPFKARLLERQPDDTTVIFIVDQSGAQPAPIDTNKVALNVDGFDYSFMAEPSEADAEGRFARFVSYHPEFHTKLRQGGTLKVSLDGTVYKGTF